MAKENPKFFAVIPIHGKDALVEAPTMGELKEGIEEALVLPKKAYPFYDFEAGITVIKGRKIKLDPKS